MRSPGTRFASDDSLWREIQARVRRAEDVRAAVAYFGQGGASILPLRRGHTLAVDMSLPTVKQGGTDPREIRTLIRRGVKVFSRPMLHAKFIIADGTLIASSANVSTSSMNRLAEAGIITRDSVALQRASDFLDRLCTEPVRASYLSQCIKAYKPPRSTGRREGTRAKGRRIIQARLWFLGGLRQLELSEEDKRSLAGVEKQAERKLRDYEKTHMSWVRYAGKPKFLNRIRPGDWVITCMTEGGPRYLEAPAQVLEQRPWVSARGTKYLLLLLECPNGGETMLLSEFRRRTRWLEPRLDGKNPRTGPIRDDGHADAILSLWTSSGRISKRR